jgi:NADP-dependent 3-hydroxy acid dehydrogenase YdfG
VSGDLWAIVGASSAVARAFALEVGKSGAATVLVGRDIDDIRATAADVTLRTGAPCDALAFDVADFDSHDRFVSQLWERAASHRLNLFYAAGAMPDQ